jgi:N-ethylmaleimide reductase
VDNRIRFVVEVVRATSEAIGAHRVGLRISPANQYNDIAEETHHELYPTLVDALNPIGLAYLHVAEADERALTLKLRESFSGPLILNPFTPAGTTGPEHLELIDNGTADALSFGALFLANPDLPVRLAQGGPFNAPDQSSFFGGTEKGYTDYPALATASA